MSQNYGSINNTVSYCDYFFKHLTVHKFVPAQCAPRQNRAIEYGTSTITFSCFQIISPHDKGISKCIMENLEPWESAWDADSYKQNSLCIDPLKDVLASYLGDIQRHCHFR